MICERVAHIQQEGSVAPPIAKGAGERRLAFHARAELTRRGWHAREMREPRAAPRACERVCERASPNEARVLRTCMDTESERSVWKVLAKRCEKCSQCDQVM